MNSAITTVFGLIGGLALFLFGMNMMSENLQKAAGEKMRSLLGYLTKTPLMGVLAGALTTMVLQSSSATTVMVIGFVSAQLMSLPQGISVILGANIGTTITAQLIAFNIADYVYPIIFLGFMAALISKNDQIKYIGLSVFSFGLLFLGINTMSAVMEPLANSQIFLTLMEKVKDIPVLGVLVGTLMTLVVQSSSATVAVLQSLAKQPAADGVSSALGLVSAIPILLGDNIGTTITAILASITQSRDAKRVAAAHCLFNITGAFLFIWFVKPYAAFIQWISPKGDEIDVISRQIANAHTIFNVVMVCIWLPLLFVLVKIVLKLLPEKTSPAAELSKPLYLDKRLLSSPAAALTLVKKEILRLGEEVNSLLASLSWGVDENDAEKLKEIPVYAQKELQLHDGILDYLNDLYETGALTDGLADEGAFLISVLSDLDRIGGFCGSFASEYAACNEKKKQFSKTAREDLAKSLSLLKKMYRQALRLLQEDEKADVHKLLKRREELLDVGTHMRRGHMDRVAKGKCKASFTKPFTHLLSLIDRAATACADMAEACRA